MPRHCCPYREAEYQKRLWTPEVLNPGIFVSAQFPENQINSSGFSQIKNRGTACSYWQPNPTYAYLDYQYGVPAFRLDDGSASSRGYSMDAGTYSLQPTDGFSAYTFGVVNPNSPSYAQTLSQYANANSVMLAMNIGQSFSIALFDGGWRSRSVNTQGIASLSKYYMSQRKTSSSASSYTDTLRSSDTSKNSSGSVACGTSAIAASGVGFMGHATAGAESKFIIYSMLHFPRYLTDVEDEIVVGWGAWNSGMQDILPANHRFKNRPPLIGD
jgi:hypothetical protein